MRSAEDPKQSLIDRYDREASAYRELWAPTLRIAGLRLLEKLADTRASRIVDVATGVGSLLPDLRRAFPSSHVFGVDRSRGMLALAPREFPIAVMDAAELGIASGSMDLVLLAFVLFHLETPLHGLREARRILCDGGRIGCMTWAGELQSTAIRIWNESLDLSGASPPDPAAITRHEAVDTPRKMDELLRKAGFSDVRVWEEELASRFDAESLLRLKTKLGSSKPRFDSLAPEASEICLADVRRRMEGLAPDDFLGRGRVVYSIAHA